MRRVRIISLASGGLAAAALVVGAGQGAAKDLGVVGALFEIAEPNLVDALNARFEELERTGAVDQLREDMTARTKGYVLEPRPVPGVGAVEEESVRFFDPSITVAEDIADHRGVVFVRAGTVVNPLDSIVAPVPAMLMIDGFDPAQVEWAMGQGTEIDSRIILVRGRPIDLTKAHKRRFYFDQDGLISDRFGVVAVPTRIDRDGRRFRITEVKLP